MNQVKPLRQMSHHIRKTTIAYAKTKAHISFAVTAKLISAFVFLTGLVQSFFFLNPKFQASSLILCLYSSVCIRSVLKPHCWYSHDAAQIVLPIIIIIFAHMCLTDKWTAFYEFNYLPITNGLKFPCSNIYTHSCLKAIVKHAILKQPPHEKKKQYAYVKTMVQTSGFVFTKQIVQSLFLKPKSQASSPLL